MSLKAMIPELLNYIRAHQATLVHNVELFEMYEGDLLKYVLKDLKAQLSENSYNSIQHRVAPINMLKRVIEKLSKIYSKPPIRYCENDSDSDTELLGWYSKCFDINTNMGMANEFFNLFKNTLIEPYVKDGKPALRICPSERFIVYSNDRVDPTKPTHVIKFMGKYKVKVKEEYEEQELFYIYSDEEFLAITDKGEIAHDIMAEGNLDGKNPIGKLPFIYINRSRHNIVPVMDTDTTRMTKIFPVLLSDLNFSVMMQSFSIIYGIDVDDQNITMSPNAFWRFKSDPASGNKPEVGVIKPQVDISQVVQFIVSQISLWLQSRNIRPGSTGQITPESFSSGISKVVDDMDTYEDRQKQIPFFKKGEEELWDLVINHVHPYWVAEGMIEEKRKFTPGQVITVEFPEQKPMVSRQELIASLKDELMLGLSTKKDAVMKLNPDMTEEQVEQYLKEIDAENTVNVDETPDPMKELNGGEMAKT